MSIELIVVLVAFIGNIILALFTLYKNPKSATNILFFLFTLSLAIYLLLNYLLTQQTTDEATFFLVKMVMSIALFINLLFFLLSSTFPRYKLELRINIINMAMPIKKIAGIAKPLLFIFSPSLKNKKEKKELAYRD